MAWSVGERTSKSWSTRRQGPFRTTNQGALSLESGIKPAAAQLDNRLRHFASGSRASQEATRPGNSLGPQAAPSVKDYSPL